MVEDRNNFDEARAAVDAGLAEGLVKLHSEVLETTIQNMTDGQDALGNSWLPITPETLFNSRETRTSTRDPLVDTGEWRADIVASSDVSPSSLTAVIGTTKAFAGAHEFGAPEQGIPRRPLFGPAGRLAAQLAPDMIGEEIDTRLKSAEVD